MDLPLKINVRELGKFKEVFKVFGIETYELSLNKSLDFYKLATANIERSVGIYIADVLVESDPMTSYRRTKFVFEIYVSLKMEDEKKQFLKKEGISYIELIPEQCGILLIYCI
jgi:hypothetical protein